MHNDIVFWKLFAYAPFVLLCSVLTCFVEIPNKRLVILMNIMECIDLTSTIFIVTCELQILKNGASDLRLT
jgi:hypothetical protein